MIERATQCLHRVGKNAIASHDQGRHAARSLHSLFWTHGANDIALPAWWNTFLQQPDSRQHPHNDTLYISPQILRSSFLDFLYPPKALEHATRLATRAARKHYILKQKSVGITGRQNRKRGISRWYTTDRTKLSQHSPELVSGQEDVGDNEVLLQKGIDALAARADILSEQFRLLEIETKNEAEQREWGKRLAKSGEDHASSSNESQALRKIQTLVRDGISEASDHKTVDGTYTNHDFHETSSAESMTQADAKATSSALNKFISEAAVIVGQVTTDSQLDHEAAIKFWRSQSVELAKAYETYLESLDAASAIPQAEDDFISAFNFEAPIITWQLQSTLQAGLAFLTLFMEHLYSKILPTDEALWTDKQWSFLIRTTMLYPKEGLMQSQPLVSVDTEFPVGMRGAFDLLSRAFAAGHGLEPAQGVLRLALQRGLINVINGLFQFCDGKKLSLSKLLAGLETVDTPLLVKDVLQCAKRAKPLPSLQNQTDQGQIPKAYLDIINQLFLQLLQRELSPEVVAAYEEIWTTLSDHNCFAIKNNIQLLNQLINVYSSDTTDASVFVHFAYRVFAVSKQQPGFEYSKQQIKKLLQKMIDVHHPNCLAVLDYYRSRFDYDSKIYKNILPELALLGEAEKWQEIYHELESKEKLVKADWVHQLLEAYARRADIATCLSLLESRRKEIGNNLDVRSWNAVLNSYVQGSDITGAIDFRKYMEQEGIVPNDTTYMILLRGYAARGESTLALEQVKQIQSRGSELTMDMVKHLMSSQIFEGNMDRAEQLLYDSARTGVLGSQTKAWNRILEAFADMGKLTDMNHFRISMNKYGIPADASTYAALMLGFCMADLPYHAHQILSKIMPANNMVPTIRHYNILIDGFIRKKMFDEAILIYQQARKRHIRTDAMTRNLIIQAISSVYGSFKKGDSGWYEVRHQALANAEEFLNKSLTEDGYQHAVSPSENMDTSGLSLDQAFASLHFEFLIQQYAHLGDKTRMDDLLQQYRVFYNKEYPNQELVEPPKILAAIGQYYLKTGNTNGIKQLWDKALRSLIPFVAATGADITKPGWVLPSRSRMIAPIFRICMIDLMRRKEHQELEGLTQALIAAGWRFPASIWNLYIRFLAMEGHAQLALKYCEEHLIEGFPGWPTGSWSGYGPKIEIEEQMPGDLNAGIMRPTYEVLCWLAKNYIDFQQKHAYSPQKVELESELWKLAPRTLKAITTMPRVSDYTQGRILRNEQNSKGRKTVPQTLRL